MSGPRARIDREPGLEPAPSWMQGALPADQHRPGMFGVTGSGDTSGFSGLQRQPWVELPARAPFGGYFDEVVDAFLAAYPELRSRRSARSWWTATS